MNKNQVKGAAKEAAGVVQKEFGKAVDSPKHAIEGTAKEVVGKTQKAAGNMQEDAKKVRKDANREAEKRGW
ncbi:MAG: CsbD family protein [Hyphomonadaceae bacterium]|nr:CsbD family protein [Hyphomonadaceae bacterium]